MSDTGRQSLASKVSAAVKPDSMKTNTESFTDKFKSSADNAAGTVEPNSQKSVPQKIGDALSGNSHSSTTTNNATEPSVGQRVKNAIGMGHNSST